MKKCKLAPDYPSIGEVNEADRYQVCYWWRFLPSPRAGEEIPIMDRIVERFREMGGFTSGISKKMGWD